MQTTHSVSQSEIDFEDLELTAKTIVDRDKSYNRRTDFILRAHYEDIIQYDEAYNSILEVLIEEEGGTWADYEAYKNHK